MWENKDKALHPGKQGRMALKKLDRRYPAAPPLEIKRAPRKGGLAFHFPAMSAPRRACSADLLPIGLAEKIFSTGQPVRRKADQTGIGMAQFEDEKDRHPDRDRASEMRQQAHRMSTATRPLPRKSAEAHETTTVRTCGGNGLASWRAISICVSASFSPDTSPCSGARAVFRSQASGGRKSCFGLGISPASPRT